MPDAAAAEHVAEVVRRRPSYRLTSGPPEELVRPTEVCARPASRCGGDLRLDTGEQQIIDTRAALCRCGATASAPFCDASGDCRETPRQRQEPRRGPAT